MLSDKAYLPNRLHYNQKSIDEIRNTILNIFNRTLDSKERAYYSHCIHLMKASETQEHDIDEEELSETEIKHYILLANSSLFCGREYSMLYDTIHPVKTENGNVRKVAV